VVVEVGIVDAAIAIAGAWTPTAVTFVVTPSLVDAAVFSCPPVIADAVHGVARRVVYFVSVVYAVFTITALWSCAAVADRIACSYVGHTSVVDPVGETLTDTVFELSVWHADITITGFITMAGVAGVEAFAAPDTTIIS